MKRFLLGSRDLEVVRLPACSAITSKDGPMRNSVAGGVIGLVILLLLSTPAEGRWRLDVEGGAFVPDDDAVSVGGSFAVGGGYSLNDYVEVGGQFQGNYSGIDIGLVSDTFEVYSLTGGPRIYVLPSTYRIRPWVVGQIGWYRARAAASFFGAEVENTEDAFGGNVGGGFDVAIVPRVSLGVDVRYHRPVDVFDGFDFVTAMLNVGLHFGG